MAFLFFTVVLDMIGIGIVIPSLPDVVRRFVSDPSQVSQIFGYFVSVYAAMQFIASPFLGLISDIKGRRPVLLVSLFVASVDYLVMAFAPSLAVLFAGRIIAGLSGAGITVAMSYIADISTDKNRAQNFGMIGAAFGLGFILGPALGGFLGHLGPQYPFIAASALTILNFLFGIFVLPESLDPSKRRKWDWSKINPLRSFSVMRASQTLLILLAAQFLLQLCGQTHPSIWTLYTGQRFGWGPKEVGLSLAVVGVSVAFVQGFLTGIVIPKFGEAKVLLIGALGSALTFPMFGFATEGWMMYAILLLSAPFFTSGPALQSIVTKQGSEDMQGELQGTLVALTSLSAILNPLIVTQLFSYFGSPTAEIKLVGAPYFFAGIVGITGFLLLLVTRSTWNRRA